MAANNSYQEAVALIASANRVVQDPNSVGAALRTISLRLRGTSTKELEEAGEDTAGAITSKSKLRSKIKGYTGIDILTDSGAYKSTYEILLEISKVWDDLNDMDRAGLLEMIAGKTRSNTAAAILSNTKDLEEAYKSAMEAEGSAYEENEKYLDSIQGKIDLFNNAIQTMWNNLLDADIIKNVVSWGTKIVQSLDTMQGKLLALVKAVVILMAYKKINPLDWIQNIGNLFTTIQDTGIKQFIKSLLGIAPAIKVVTAETLANTVAIQLNDTAKTKDMMTSMGLASATGTLSAAQKEQAATAILNAMSTGQLTIAQGNAMLAMLGYAGATLAADGSLKLLDKTTKSFMATNPMGWILAIVSVIMIAVTWISSWKSETEKLEEELSSLNSEINTIKGELDSLNSELETTKDRIAELLALPSLSLTEQEELKNLQLQNAELEQRIKLQEALLETQEQTRLDTAKDWINNVWNGKNLDKKYAISPEGVITEDKWDTRGVSGKDAINSALKEYQALQEENLIVDEILDAARQEYDADGKLSADTKKAIADFYGKKGIHSTYTWDAESSIRNLENRLALNDSDLSEISTGINTVLGDMADTISENDLSYALGDTDINAFLDDYYAQFDAWQVAQGISNKSDVIANMFGSTATEEVKELGAQLKEIANDEKLTLDQQRTKIKGVIDSLNTENTAYNALKQTMDAVDINAENIADYFVESATIDSSTIEGITTQYSKATEVLNKFKNGLSVEGIDSDGNKLLMSFDDLFTFDDKANKWKADSDKISQILKETDEQTRKQFEKYITHIKNAQQEATNAGKDFDITEAFAQASKNIEIDGLLRVIDITKESLSSINQVTFKGVADEINGLIDTFDEFGKALEDTASAMDTIYKAQKQMNSSGRISVKTALELMQSTEDWNSILEINGDTIKLQDNAEQSLIQSRLNLIEQNINTALSEAELQYAKLEGADATLLQGDADLVTVEAQKEFDKAMNQSAAVSAGLGAAAGNLIEKLKALANLDFDSSAWNTSMTGAFNTAYTSALTVLDKQTNPESAEEVKQRINDLRAQKDMIGQLKKNSSSFKNYYDYDETPGDKYDDDGSDDALEKLRKKYERQIENLDNQQTYLQNEIDRLEAENEVVSKSYYEKQIALEEQKLDLYQQEREALLKLKMTDEVAEALWETEHAIQESTLRMVEFRKSIIELYKTAFDDVIAAYDNKDDFLSDQQNYIEKYRELMELQGEAPDAYGYQEQIANEEEKMADNIAELNSLRQTLAEGMANGGIKEGSEEWIEMQDKIRAAEEAVLDNKIAIEEYRQELKQLSVDTFELVRNAFSNKDNFLTNQQEYIQGYADLLEAQGIDVPAEIYDELIKIEQEKRANNVANLVDARQGLADIEAAGYTAVDEEWQDAYQQVVDLEKAVQDNDIAMAEYAKTIRDLDFEKFERFISRLDDLNSEIDNLRGLYDDEDVAFEDGTWTKEGITSLGLLYHQMELNQGKSEEYAEKIEELNQAYDNGEMSEQEYYESLQELKDGQWDAINAYESAKDAIVDLEEARIDMIEEGINKEIEAYEDLIEVKKEELDAERDLYEFKKDVQKQTKDIESLERRLASLSGSTNASDVAERRKLEAELYETQEGLNDTYYGHAKDQQNKALDDEADAYRDAQEKYLETLRDTLEFTEEIINEKIAEVLTNADVVLDEINNKSGSYNVTVNPLLTSPWENASAKSLEFKTQAESYLTSLLNDETGIVTFATTATTNLKNPFEAGSEAAELFATTIGVQLGTEGASGYIVSFGTNNYGKLDGIFNSGKTAAGLFTSTVNTGIESVKTTVLNSTSSLTSNLKLPWNDTTKEDGPISTFSTKAKGAIEGALTTAQNNATKMKTALTSPWIDGTNAVNTFSTNAKKALDEVKKKVDETAAAISKTYDISVPSNVGKGSDDSNGTTPSNPSPSTPSSTYKTGSNVKALQKFLNQYWNTAVYNATGSSQLSTDGSYGPLTKKAVKAVQKTIGMSASAQNGEWNIATTTAMTNYYRGKMRDMANYPSSVAEYEKRWKAMPTAIYAKGTLGTKRDELAITDESWIGEEITLAAGKNGQLQYLKKGSAVMPADISANLVEWGKINPDMSNIVNGTHSVNLMSNYVSKPEINLAFDALVKADKITEDTLPEVKKFVQQEINSLVKQMNYALKGYSR